MRNELFGWVWEEPTGWYKVGSLVPVSDEEKSGITPRAVNKPVTERPPLNLQRFLEVTAGYEPNYQEYLQIIYYCASVGLDRDHMVTLCNEAWNPKDPGETARVYDGKKRGYDAVSKGSVFLYLQKHATQAWTRDEIFGRRYFEYYNEGMEFALAKGTAWDLEILNQFCDDVFSFCTNEKKFVYKIRVRQHDDRGNRWCLVTTKIQDEVPYAGTDSIMVLVRRSEKELLGILKKQIPKSVKTTDKKALALVNLMNKVEDMTPFDRIAALEKALEPDPKRKLLGTILKDRLEQGFIKRYDMLSFTPYLHEDPTPPNVCNTWSPYPLLKYRATRNVDFTKTTIWKWLYDVYAHKNEARMKTVLNLLAWFLQNPAKRSERIWVIMSKGHGTGKSTWYHLLMALTSPEHGVFYRSMEEFLGGFNILQMNRLILFVDEVKDATPRQAKKLHAMTTAKTQIMNGKNQRTFQLDVRAEIFCTTNSALPIYVTADDRRCAYMKVSDEHKQSPVLFDALYAEFGDINVRKAAFDFLVTREIGKWRPTPDNDLDPSVRMEQKTGCMCAPWSFIVNHFKDEQWPQRFCDFSYIDCSMEQLKQRHDEHPKGTVRIRIVASRLFKDFKKWNSECNNGSKCKETTFWEALKDIGLRVKPKQRFRKSENGKETWRTVVDIYYSSVSKALKKQISGFKMPEWPSEDPDTYDQLKKMVDD